MMISVNLFTLFFKSFLFLVLSPYELISLVLLRFQKKYILCQVFNVKLNQEHIIVQDLDIFSLVGLGAAYDEIVPFSVKNNILSIKNEKSKFNGVLSVEFVKVASNSFLVVFFKL